MDAVVYLRTDRVVIQKDRTRCITRKTIIGLCGIAINIMDEL